MKKDVSKNLFFPQNNRGQGLSVNAIILIVLGVLVLVMLIIGFTMGWDRLAPWIQSSNNVDQIVQACSLACSTSSTYDFCSVDRTLNDAEKKNIQATCYELSIDDNLKKYGVSGDCNINCKASVECDGWFYLGDNVEMGLEINEAEPIKDNHCH